MKIRPRFFAPLLVLSAALAPAHAQQAESVSRTANWIFNIDEHGDAAVEVSFQHSASQWANWKEEYGTRPDIVLRDLRYSMATAVLDNFSMERDDVQRKALNKVRAKAFARYRNAGEFVIDVAKEMKLVTGANTDWIFSMTNGLNGEIVSQTLHLKLPAGAKNVHFGPGGDFDNLSYTLDVTPTRPKGWLNAGIAMLSTGVGLLVISLFTKRKNPLVIIPESATPVQRPPSLPPE
jgi:hypothetical protein